MAEEENIVSFIGRQFRQLNARFDAFETRMNERFDRLEERVAQVERRLTASTHFEQGLVAHMASLHASMDQFRATAVAFDRRIVAIEAR